MKNIRLTLISFLLGFGSLVFGQDQDSDIKYIFKNNTDLKGFGTIEMKLSDILNETGLLIGGNGGVTVNKYFLFGAGGYGIVTKTTVPGTNPDEPLRLYGGYGGLMIGFNLFPREVVHLSFPILIGAGNIDIVDENFFSNSFDQDFTVERSAFFVAEPGVLLEINVTSFFHLGLGASYRYIDGLNMANINSSDLTDWSGNVSFKFGGY